MVHPGCGGTVGFVEVLPSAAIGRIFEEAKRIDDEEDKLYGKGRRGDELPPALRTADRAAEAAEGGEGTSGAES